MNMYRLVAVACCCMQLCYADSLTNAVNTLAQKMGDLTTELKKSVSKKVTSPLSPKQIVTKLLSSRSAVSMNNPYVYSTTYGLSNNKVIKLEVVDITKMKDVQAIVNAANAQLQSGGGVCGAIYGAAGCNELTKIVDDWKTANNKPSGINVGEAAITGVPFGKVNKLPENIQYVVHAVGPDCRTSEKANWKQSLKNAYTNSLIEAAKKNVTSIAFPSISTAIYGCDPEEAAPIALQAVVSYLENNPTSSIQKVVFVFWPNKDGAAEEALQVYDAILDDAFAD